MAAGDSPEDFTREFDDYWGRVDDRRKDPLTRERIDKLRAEYRALAQRNLQRVEATAEANAHAWRKIKRVLWALAFATVLIGYLTVKATEEPGQRITAIQDQRRDATKVTCAALGAVIDAGRNVISGNSTRETPFMHFLERHGYPPPRIRRAQANAQAAGYAETIITRVEHAIGRRRAVRIITPDGSIDCAAFVRFVGSNN